MHFPTSQPPQKQTTCFRYICNSTRFQHRPHPTQTTLTGGDIITGQLTSGMLVNYSTDDLQQQDSQHEPIVIDAFAGSEDDGDIVELYHSEPQQLHVDDQQSYARAGRNGGILQFANTSMTIASIVDGGARNGTHVIVPNAVRVGCETTTILSIPIR